MPTIWQSFLSNLWGMVWLKVSPDKIPLFQEPEYKKMQKKPDNKVTPSWQKIELDDFLKVVKENNLSPWETQELYVEYSNKWVEIPWYDDMQKQFLQTYNDYKSEQPKVEEEQSFMSRFWQDLKQSWKEILAPSLWALQWLSKVWQKTVWKIPELITWESVSSEWLFGETEKMWRFTFWEEVWKLIWATALTAPIWWLWALWKWSYFVNLLKNIWLWATEWVVWQWIYNVAWWNEFTKDATLAWTIWWAIPLLWAWLGKVSKMTWLAEKLQSSWLLNPERMTYLKNTLIKEHTDELSNATPDDVAQWMIQRDIKGSKEAIIKKLDQAGKESKWMVDWMLAQSRTTHNITEAEEALFQIAWDIENLPWMWAEFATVIWKLKDWGYTLSELNAIKRDIDRFYTIYKKSWDVKEWLKAQWLDNIRKWIKTYIEEAAQKEWLWNIKLLNNETAMANWLRDAISKKESADAVREFLWVFSRGTIWWVVWTQTWPFDRNTVPWQIGNFLVWALVWNVAGSTAVRTNIANFIWKLSWLEKKELKRFIWKEIDEKWLSEWLVTKIWILKDKIWAKVSQFWNDLWETIVKNVDEWVPTQRRWAVWIWTPEEVLKNRELADWFNTYLSNKAKEFKTTADNPKLEEIIRKQFWDIENATALSDKMKLVWLDKNSLIDIKKFYDEFWPFPKLEARIDNDLTWIHKGLSENAIKESQTLKDIFNHLTN